MPRTVLMARQKCCGADRWNPTPLEFRRPPSNISYRGGKFFPERGLRWRGEWESPCAPVRPCLWINRDPLLRSHGEPSHFSFKLLWLFRTTACCSRPYPSSSFLFLQSCLPSRLFNPCFVPLSNDSIRSASRAKNVIATSVDARVTRGLGEERRRVKNAPRQKRRVKKRFSRLLLVNARKLLIFVVVVVELARSRGRKGAR